MTATWTVDETKVLQPEERRAVVEDLRRKARRSVNTRQNLALFRLASCCGLRASELVGLRLDDVVVGVARPYVRVRKETTKADRRGRRKARTVPLWWDEGTLADLTAWKAERQKQGAGPSDPFICTQSKAAFGKPLHRLNARTRFIAACRVLGKERCRRLTLHHGRHTFVSSALAAGISLAHVRDAAGHRSASTTDIYTHVLGESGTGNIFA